MSNILKAIRLAAQLEAERGEVQFRGLCAVCWKPSFLDIPCLEGEPSPRKGGMLHVMPFEAHEGIEPESSWSRG